MFARIFIGSVRGDEMTNPAEQSARAEPEARRDDEPQDASQDAAIIELSNSRDKQTENCRQSRIAHCLSFTSVHSSVRKVDTTSRRRFRTVPVPTRAS